MTKDPRNHDTPNHQPGPHLDAADLAQFTGTTQWYRHPMNTKVLYTDGVQYLAAKGEAYWLIDAIVSHLRSPVIRQALANDDRLATLQFWQLTVNDDRSAVLTCRADSDEEPAITQPIDYTDFPLAEIDIWCGRSEDHWVLYLPSEH